jgi:hypothetical protein
MINISFLLFSQTQKKKYGKKSFNLQNGHNPKSYIFKNRPI